jgi:P27 family predicted phage terminase small subunit
MGRRGPRAKSAEQHELNGNPSKRLAKTDAAASVLKEIPSPPNWLPKLGQEAWRRLAPALVKHERLSDMDLGSFAMLCEAWSRYRTAVDDIAENGAYGVTDKGYEYARPSIGICNTALSQINALSAKFGLTPLDRVGFGPRKEIPDDPLNELEDVLGASKSKGNHLIALPKKK